jgi:glucose/arabinose dehydrogenase
VRGVSLLPALLLGATAALAVDPGEEIVAERAGGVQRPPVEEPTAERVAGLRLPAGFQVGVFARGLGAPRMLAVGADGTVYVTRREPGDVLALRDGDGDGRAEGPRVVVGDLPGAHGVAVDGDTLWVATVREVYRVPLRDGAAGAPERVVGDLPPGGRHPNRTLARGPDGALYVSVGSTCNCCVEAHPESAAIVRLSPDGRERRVFAAGLRNTIGFAWHPATNVMWGMDHGTDWLGDDFPPEELNRLEAGRHYGWPFVHGDGRMPEAVRYPPDLDRDAFRARAAGPVLGYTAHAAPIQMAFYTGTQFPPEYRDDAFVAMHGSWNRRPAAGYEVARVRFEDGEPRAVEPFLTGFLLDGGAATFGRPAGIAVARDGALLVGDDETGVIYRVSYAARRCE